MTGGVHAVSAGCRIAALETVGNELTAQSAHAADDCVPDVDAGTAGSQTRAQGAWGRAVVTPKALAVELVVTLRACGTDSRRTDASGAVWSSLLACEALV